MEFAYNKLDMTSFKDSTAIYTCNIQLVVSKGRPLETVVSSNDTTVSKYIKGLDSLKKFDFEPLLGNNKCIKLIVPVAVIVSSSSNNRQCIDAHILAEKIKMLHYYDGIPDVKKLSIIQLFPLIVTLDKKVYE